jgi:hypothetical protein
MTKLSKTAKTLDIVFRIAHIVATIALVALIVSVAIFGAALLFDLDPDMVGTGFEVITVGPLELTLSQTAAPAPQQVMAQMLVLSAIALVSIFAVRMYLQCIRGILQPMKEGKPFHNTISTNLKKLAWLEIVTGMAGNILIPAELVLTAQICDIPALFDSSRVTNVMVNYELDATFLLMAGVLFLLSYIFRHGEQLQQLEDETL